MNKINNLIIQAEDHINSYKEYCRKIKTALTSMISKEIDFDVCRKYMGDYIVISNTPNYNYVNVSIDKIIKEYQIDKIPLTEEKLYKLSLKN